MARKLEDIFNECYERIRAGESLQSCLARYPEYHAELKQLLETSLDIGRRASYIHPRPEFKHWAQVRLQGAQHYHANQQRQVETPSHFGWWRQSWALAVTAVFILLLTTGSTMAASSNAMPDQTLYPVKLATEEMRLAVAATDAQKFRVHAEIAETRAEEIEVMANEGKTEYAAIAVAGLAEQLDSADALLARIERTFAEAQPPTAIPEPTPMPTPEPTPMPTPEPTPTPTPEPTPMPTPEPTPTPTPEPTITTTPEPTPTPTPEPTPTPTPEPTPTPTPEPTPTPTPEPTITTTPEPTPTPTPEPTTPATTKYDKWAAARERLKNRLEESKSKSQAALENAHENASEQAKPEWQRSIDTISKKSYKKQTQSTSQSDNKTGNVGKSDNTSPNNSQHPSWDWRNR